MGQGKVFERKTSSTAFAFKLIVFRDASGKKFTRMNCQVQRTFNYSANRR